jgi:hypothetical protein
MGNNNDITLGPRNYFINGGAYKSHSMGIVRDPTGKSRMVNWDQIPCVVLPDVQNNSIPVTKINNFNNYLSNIINNYVTNQVLGDNVKEERVFGTYKDPGVSLKAAREDHGHGNPALDITPPSPPYTNAPPGLKYVPDLGKIVYNPNQVPRYNEDLGKLIFSM